MSVSRRGDKTHTGRNGVATDRLRGDDKLRQTPGGQFGRHAAPSQEAMRTYIASQRCPWCDAGPFKMLATHTHRKHGISAAELRDLAGMFKGDLICSPEYSQTRADMRAGQRLPDSAYERDNTRPRTYSAAGLRSQRERAAKATHEDRKRAARASGDKQLHANAAKHQRILAMYQAGHPTGTIAQACEVSQPTVLRTLKREGVWVDGRARRWTLSEGTTR